MPIRGVGDSLEGGRWIASARWIDDIEAERAQARYTLSYRLSTRFQLGVEWNPIGDDAGPLANWVAIQETRHRPALLIGTSSDRIGTEEGQAYFATVSKNLDGWIGIDASPYLGAAWSDFTNEWRELAGLQYRLFGDRLSVTHLWDGVNLHHTVDFTNVGEHTGLPELDRTTIGAIVAEQDGDYFLGMTVGVRF